MKWCNAKNAMLMACAGLALWISGCGSSSANVITVTVSPSVAGVIAGQVQTFTATVGGSTVTTVTNWTCQYSYTPAPTTSTPNPTAVTGTCTSGGSFSGGSNGETGSFGSWTTSTANGSNVLTYTAPTLANFPKPYVPTLTFTAEADADTKKTGTATVSLDSGIRTALSPTTATVPVGLTPNAATATFNVTFTNTPPVGVQYLLVQTLSSSSYPNNAAPSPTSVTCSPACGSMDSGGNGIYTAPSTLPTATTPSGGPDPATVWLVAWSSSDQVHYAVAQITLVSATTNAVNYTGLYPTTVQAGGLLQDVYLNAANLLNNTQISFISPTSVDNLASSPQQSLNTSGTQIFTIPISGAYCTPSPTGTTPVVTCDASILTRVRLLSNQLKQAEPDPTQPAWIVVSGLTANLPTSPNAAGCVNFPQTTTVVACPVHIVKADPALVTAVPDSTPIPSSGQASLQFAADGGYYGVSGSLATMLFNGNGVTLNTNPPPAGSGPRQLIGQLQAFQLPNPGLYEVSVNSNTLQPGVSPLFSTLITNTAVQPNFATFNANPANTPSPACTDPSTSTMPLGPTYPSCVPLNGTGNPAPSAIVLNSTKGYAVISEQATGALQYVSLTPNGPLQIGAPLSIAPAVSGVQPTPTGMAIDSQLNVNGGDLLAVVSGSDNTLYLFSVVPGAGAPITFVKSISLDLRTLLSEPGVNGLPAPYAIGIDPVTHLGVVAYAGTNSNIAFIVDANPNLDGSDQRACFLGASVHAPCVTAPVSVVTGFTPSVVMQPNVPLAYVTPGGGASNTSVVDLLQQGTSAQIEPFVSGGTSGAVRTAGVTKIITSTPHGINPILGGTVIISGVLPTKTTNSNFNGTFLILPGSVLDPYTFSYTQIGMNDDVESNPANTPGTVQYGTAYYSLGTSAFVAGAAINPITRTFGYADYNQSSSQIGFISTLDQTLSTLTLSQGSCNGCTPTPPGAPEIGFRSVAFDPFVDVMLAYAPTANTTPEQDGNKISLINPGGANLNGSTNPPYRIIAATPTGQIGQGSYTPAGSSTPVPVYGPMAYDPKTRFVMVANAGSNSLTYMSIDPGGTFQKAHVQDLQLPVPSCGNPAVPQTCFGVPVIQPALDANNPSHSPGPCSPTNPSNPCMPQAIQVGVTATVRILGQGFGTAAGSLARLDGKTSNNCAGNPGTFCTTWVSDNELDLTIPGSMLIGPHVYAVDVAPTSGGITNEIDLNVVGLLDMASGGTNGCTPTTSFPQGPEGVAVDPLKHVALVTNYACNNVTVVAIDPNGYMRKNGSIAPFGTILGSVAVGNQPIGVALLPRLGLNPTNGVGTAVVTNSGGSTGNSTQTGTASIIDYSNPESPQLVSWTVTTTSGSTTTTTTANYVSVGLSPLGVTFDQDRGLALVANNGSNTLSAIDLTTLLPTSPADGSGHVQGAPLVTTIALSGPPTAIAVDPNRAVAAVTNLQNSGTTSVSAGIDVVNLGSVPPVKSSTASAAGLSAALTGIVYDPGDQNVTNTTTTGLFYASSTQANAIYSFNPTIGSVTTIRVGINPYSLGYNYQTGGLLTVNSTSNTSSLVDVQNFTTRQTLGISSKSQFSIDVDNVSNIAVIPDQNNNRVIFLAMPK